MKKESHADVKKKFSELLLKHEFEFDVNSSSESREKIIGALQNLVDSKELQDYEVSTNPGKHDGEIIVKVVPKKVAEEITVNFEIVVLPWWDGGPK